MSSTGVQRVLHGPHSDPINSNVVDPVPMDESECQAYDSRVKKIYLEDLRKYIAGMKGSLGDGWCVEFKYCDKRCKTYAVYEGPNENVFESRDEVARHLGLHHSCSSKSRKSGANCCSPGSSFFHNGGSSSYQTDDYPVQFEDFFIISAGNVDPRPSYHSNNEIWPVGYSSCWHDRITGSILFCEVADGGDPGPVFKVRRYPCEMWPILVGSTVLSTYKSDSQIGEDSLENDNAATSELIDEESIFIEALLAECSPPDLSNYTLALDNQHKFPVLEKVNPKHGNICPAELVKEHRAGEFLVKGKSVSSVWELVSQTLQLACTDAYKEKGVIQFCCTHYAHNNKMDEKEPGEIGSLSRFSYSGGPSNFPRIVHSPSEFKTACEMLDKWLCQDRFGFDSDFVQEIIEQLPGVLACYSYKLITTRKQNTTLQTVGSGFLLAKREHEKEAVAVGSDIKGPCPSGKPLTTKIPTLLIGDAIQVWEFWLRFSDVLGLEAPFSFEEIEEELVSPWKESTSSTEMAGHSQCSGLLLAKIHGLLLKALVTKLLSEVAVYIDSHSGAGGSAKSSRRGRKKDAGNLAFLEKTRLEMLPINAITWPEVARRYMLALLSMEVDLESAEIACRESGKFFHCLQGDGGTLCGSLTGVAALEADALFLAEATKKIFGSPKSGSIFVAIDEVSDAKVANDGQVPEWAKVLEPVRKLPTNVGSRIRKCVNEALEKNPPEWARKILAHSISKDVYRGNASGPTKRAVVSVLDNITLLKPEKEEKVKSDTSSSLSDLITKQCRIILRRSVKEDKDKVFCNLLGRTVLNPNDNDDEGLLGHPAMVSRPLDFRTVDLRLAAGSYGGSHESFLDDVREVWHNIRTAYCNDSDLLELAEFLSQKFEDDYKNEVLSLVNKIECSKDISLMSENAEVRDELFVRVNERSIPDAPWEEEICKVCGVDKDDSNVLLCDGCDSEYHIYCLDPPLINVPDGKWYCPPCKATVSVPQNTSSSSRVTRPYVKKRLNRKNLTHNFMEALSQLTRTMELKEYWELSLENRIFLLKFLCDEVLNSPILCDHIDQKASKSAELQQKLHILGAELRLRQCREEILTTSHAKLKSNAQNSGEVRSDVLASSLRSDDSKLKVLQEPDSGSRNSSISGGCRLLDDTGNQIKASPDSVTHLQHQQCRSVSQTHDTSLHNEVFISAPQQEINQTPENYLESAQSSSSDAKYVWQCSIPAEPTLAQAYLLDITAVKNQIRTLEDSIAAKELELHEVSVRKDCLGLDSNGRAYWTFGRSGSSQLLANSSMSTQMESSQRFWPYGVESSRQSGVSDSSAPWENMGMPNLSQWSSYKSDAEIEKLLGWLRENDTREKGLKESILKWRSNNSNKESMPSKDSGCGYDSDPLVTRAVTAIKKKIGGCLAEEEIGVCNDTGGFYRCDCLEPLWPSRPHCVSCHQTFPTAEEHVKHGNGKCKISAIQGSYEETSEPPSKRKKLSKNDSIDVSHGSESKKLRDDEASRMNKKGNAPASCETQTEQERPFNFEEIKGKFIIPSSLKELVKEIGLIGCNGTPSFVSCTSPYLSDPALKLVSKREDWVGAGKSSDLFSIEQESQNVSGNPNCTVNGFLAEVGPMIQRPNNSGNQLSYTKDKMVEFIPGSSLLPLVGRASVILRCLRINLLDIDAALPEEALRVSRSQSERRCAWRAFVKSASTIYEMVLAIIILEDAVKTDYLRKDWWYWSSPSAAARISTLSGLALRVYALDSAVLYDKLSYQDASETDYKEETEPHNSDPLNMGSPSRQLRTC